ncbi:hypothetical protein B0H13DRAFT_1588397 [Mycena leptocephala]|nr:hypothetical protein B0H13DRAFT_1588438 [Mycena leptocephala]KAJ7937616.1 hypothetical protein B0H13DRAFT_1588397 [Mycena leptocephala]
MIELIEAFKVRVELLGVPLPEMVTVDNCCTVGNKLREVIPNIKVLLDVYHFITRYGAGILGGVQNPLRNAVLKDIKEAVLKVPSSKGVLAQYWSQPEQEIRLSAAYNKWAERGGVWSAAASNIHAVQMQHIRKACLARPREDIASDGSRIEGSHKGWNSIQRSFASGLEMQTALGHDFVLRRNIRVALNGKAKSPSPFVKSTFGSHHLALVDHTAEVWNDILAASGASSTIQFLPLPRLPDIQSGEKFGLVNSLHTDTFGGLFTIKQDPNEDDGDMIKELDSEAKDELMSELNLRPVQFLRPEHVSATIHTDGVVIQASSSLAVPQLQIPPTIPATKSLEDLTAPLPKPKISDGLPKLSRSQQFFSAQTGTDPRSLKLHRGHEFYLFMDMRREFNWKSYDMSSKKWAEATKEYNVRLRRLPGGSQFIQKNPRALLEKLVEIEPHIAARLSAGDFTSAAGTTKFWETHCHAVSFIKIEASDAEPTAGTAADPRKPQTCTRCKTIKYPGPKGAPENHKLNYCSDGFRPSLKHDTPPVWPLPAGIFTNGSDFHPRILLAHVRELYEALVVQSIKREEFSMEEEAFYQLLESRTVVGADGAVMFKLFPEFNVPAASGVPDDMYVDYQGVRHLYINSLRDTDLVVAQ